MKYKAFAIFIVMAVANVFGMDYSNQEYGIHFVLPDDWKVIDFKSLPLEKQQKLDNRYHPFKTLAICGLKGHESTDIAQIIIQHRKFERSNFDKAKRYIRTENAKEGMISSAETNIMDAIGREIKQYKLVESESEFLNSTNRLYGIVHYESNDKPKIVGMEVKFLCKDGWVGLRCFARGSEADGFVNIVNKIADSFQYDGGRNVVVNETSGVNNEISQEEAERVSREQTVDTIWKWVGIFLTVSIILGLLKMLFFRD